MKQRLTAFRPFLVAGLLTIGLFAQARVGPPGIPDPILVLEVTDENGHKADWDIYFGPSAASALRRRGYAADTLGTSPHSPVAEASSITSDFLSPI